ncbi:MAG: deoxyribonuclease IV [Patescibacteria group bacterium]|nr:deoxyribonuclease IV [Patescibacteria group bacterium]
MKVGYHVSISREFSEAIDIGESLSCEAIQIFTTNPKAWTYETPKEEEIIKFRKRWADSDIKNIFGHSIYLVNLASANPYIRTNSYNSLLLGLKVCDNLGIDGLITHIGSHKGRGVEEGIEKVSELISKMMKVYEGKTPLILENSAGSGDHLGRDFNEIKKIIDKVKDERVNICLDTAHAFESGYDLKSKEGLDKLLTEIDNKIGIKKLKVVHLNDSKSDLGSNIDRHEDIGEGAIGKEAFTNIVNHPALRNLPGILETPNFENEEKGKTNLEIIKFLER